MNIDKTEKDKLYRGFELFRDAFSLYIISLLQRKVGDDWKNEFLKTLAPHQLQAWDKKERKGKKPENIIDFQHFKFFSIKNRDLLREDFEEKTNRLPTLLEEIVEARNNYAHFEEIDEDEAAKAWINMRTIAKILGMSELEQEIRNLEKGQSEVKTSPQELEQPPFNPVPVQTITDEIKLKPDLPKQKFAPTQTDSAETLDIVNCAADDFRKTVFSHQVYLCPIKGGNYQHKQCKYLGIYWEKKVGAVAGIEAVIDVHSENEQAVYFINGNRNVEEYIAEAKDKALELRPNDLPIRVFLLEKLYSTDFVKDSPGGMFGSKIYLNVENLDVADAQDLAEKLSGKKYSNFELNTNISENSIEFIASAVSQNPGLSLKVVKGGHHRIMKTGFHGSLWIVKTATRGFRVETNGDVAAYLNSEIKHLLGRESDQVTGKGYKIWFVDTADDVTKIIDIYGNL